MGNKRDKKDIFKEFILNWYQENGREFPWRETDNPYYILISEILLQKTNAEKVISPYNEITSEYSSVIDLAEAEDQDLLDIIKELGLYYRAERLINISEQVINHYDKEIPNNYEDLVSIKGIGDYAANAILCFGYGLKFPIVDSNVIRVFKRYFGLTSNKNRPRNDKNIWDFADKLLPEEEYVKYNYGLLDFAAVICRHYNPKCNSCDLSKTCNFFNDEMSN